MRGLHRKLTLYLIGFVAGILLFAGVVLQLESSYHFQMYHLEQEVLSPHDQAMYAHFAKAFRQSVLYTAIGSLVFAIVVSFLLAKRLTSPLVKMRQAAEAMSKGRLDVRTDVQGRDELADLGRSLNRLAEDLMKQEALRKTMTSDIAHELRTPLATLKSHMEAFVDGVWEPTPARIQSCYEEIERLIQLVQEMEQLTWLESPEFTLNRRKSDLSSIAQQTAKGFAAACMLQDVKLDVEAERAVYAHVDPERVTQILVNLLSNALKYTPEGGTITVRVREEAEAAVVEVADTGIGIDPQELPRIFERLYRVEKSRGRDTGGSGIGLTIVKKLTEAHGGRVAVHSEPGVGTTMSVFFPKLEPTQEPHNHPVG